MRIFLLISLALAALLVACGDDDGGGSPTPGNTTPAVTNSPTIGAGCAPNLASPAAEGDLTWEAILPEDIPAPEGFTVEDAEGEGPFINVLKDGDAVGSIELLQFPLPEELDPQQGINGLSAWATTFLDGVQAEREAAGNVFERDRIVPVPFGFFCSAIVSYTVRSDAGEVIERYVAQTTFDLEKIYLAVALYDAATPELGFQSPEVLAEYEPGFTFLMTEVQMPVP